MEMEKTEATEHGVPGAVPYVPNSYPTGAIGSGPFFLNMPPAVQYVPSPFPSGSPQPYYLHQMFPQPYQAFQHMFPCPTTLPHDPNIGSFSQLLMSAQAGSFSHLLNNDGVKPTGPVDKSNTAAHPAGSISHLLNDVGGSPTQKNNTDAHQAETSVEIDEGYLGGEEYGRGKFDVDEDLDEPEVAKECEDGLFVGDESDNGNGSDVNEDAAEFVEEDGGGSDDNEDISSESSGEEEEITVEMDLAQEFYVNKEQEGVPYRKRKRVQQTVRRPNCRTPRLMGAVERALRSAPGKKEGEYVFQPVVGMVFDSRLEAREFYNMYSWEVGFGIRFNSSRPLRSARGGQRGRSEVEDEPYISMQEIVCQQSGHDDRITTGTIRCGCPAKIRLLRTEDYGWYISIFEPNHNHELSTTSGEKRELNSHRQIEPCMKEMIKHLRNSNVPLTKVHCIMGDMYGSKDDVPWTKRSFRTICNQIKKDQMCDDMRKTMEIFREMHKSDPGFQFSVELDKHKRVRTLLWCSGRGREHYACFGDVVTFDTTYCTNIYKMPFGLFVGVNNHFQTTIFAGVLMRRETAKSFKWVFNEFLELMGGKAPQTILTDQCKAMAKAIRWVMPITYHLWCKWHVMKKIRESLGPLYTKNKRFRNEFWLIVTGMLTEDEFENAWADLVRRYSLEKNGFMNRIYSSKKKWAKPWSKDKFCARMSSTQRSESANFMLKQYVPRNSSMNHFVSQYQRLLHDREREEDIAEHRTKQLRMVHSRLWAMEQHALKIYTKAAFELFRNEVDKSSNYKLGTEDGINYTLTHNRAEIRAQWARVIFKIEIVETDEGRRYNCECGLYDHFGILCCHALRVMLHQQLDEIPKAHIMKRWTRDARDVLPVELKRYQKDHSAMHSKIFRDRVMDFQAVKLKAKGHMDLELFEVIMKHMKAAEKEADEILANRAKNSENIQEDDSSDDEMRRPKGNEARVCPVIGGDTDGGRNCYVPSQNGKRNAQILEGNSALGEGSSSRKRNNQYGASGSSAHYSDSELISMKAPYFKRPAGRPRNNRFYAGSEGKKKKWQKNNPNNSSVRAEVQKATDGPFLDQPGIVTNDGGDSTCKSKPKTKREIRCGKCGIGGHNSKQCCTLEINETTAPDFF